MSTTTPFSNNNLILTGLPAEDLERLRPHLEAVELKHGEILYEMDDPIDFIYFPSVGMISVVNTTPSGQTAEVGVIGSEGIGGVEGMLNEGATSLNRQMIQMPGEGMRAKTSVMKTEFDLGGAFQQAALACTRAMMTQMSQTGLCNRLHTAEQRLAKWLLMCHDRAAGDVLPITQEFAAIMLGANRTSVTLAAGNLQDQGFIEYSRGRITITDRAGLEAFACECYARLRIKNSRVSS